LVADLRDGDSTLAQSHEKFHLIFFGRKTCNIIDTIFAAKQLMYFDTYFIHNEPIVTTFLSPLAGICTTNDLDFLLHMNNARYLRECDFGRFKLWLLSGVWDAVKKLSGQVTLGASTIRYRKSLQLGQRYIIKTKVRKRDINVNIS
jgi:hypothetical protein